MDLGRWQRIKGLFEAASRRQESERATYLAEVCGQDDAIRSEVESLLEHQPTTDRWLASLGELLEAEGPAGDEWIGPYRVLRELGRGGMARVYLAERDRGYRQTVAVKVPHPGLEVEPFLERLRRERQILAGLRHPSIVRLLDGGVTDDGRPYLVMDYIEGEAFDRYCDLHRLTVDARLRLFGQVCAAVQHAHANLVVHRDLKPSNILVTAEGMPYLLDFGIAKLLNRELAGTTPLDTVAERVMTPEFASPEQIRGEGISAATDVYALGALLYRLLSGRHPYALQGATPWEVGRRICEEQPRRPSLLVRESWARRGPATPSCESLASARSSTPRRLSRSLHGDLDAIVLKALDKDPGRRYASAEDQGVRAEQISSFLLDLLELPPSAALEEDGLLQQGLELISRAPPGAAGTRAALLEVLGRVALNLGRYERAEELLYEALELRRRHLGAGHGDVARSLQSVAELHHARGELALAEPLFRQALEFSREALGPADPNTADSWHHLGIALQEMGELKTAEEAYRQGLRLRRDAYGEKDPAVAESLHELGEVLGLQGRLEEAEQSLRQALAIRLVLFEREHPAVALNLQDLGWLLGRSGSGEAEPLLREALEVQRRLLGEEHPRVASALYDLGFLLYWRGRSEEAVGLLRRSLAVRRRLFGDVHLGVTEAENGLALALQAASSPDEAEGLYLRAIDGYREILGAGSASEATVLTNLGGLYRDRGDLPRAERFLRQGLELQRAVLGETSPDLARSLLSLGALLHSRGRHREAAALLAESFEIYSSTYGEEHWVTATAQSYLGASLLEMRLISKAEPHLRRGHELLSAHFGEDHPRTVKARQRLARLSSAGAPGAD